MDRRQPPSLRRVIIAVLALYAFLLQGVFAGAASTVAGSVLEHAALCSPGGGEPAQEPPHEHAGACCLFACPGGLAPPLAAASVEHPRPGHARIAWSPSASLSTAPPVHSSSPRGPPAI